MRLLIVGAGMAAAYLLQELGASASRFDITVVGEESDVCYNRVLLSNLLAGDSAESDLGMLDWDALPPNIEFVSGARVSNVDPSGSRVLTSCGQELDYDRLIIATGASVATPPLVEKPVEGVEQFRTLEDARRLRQRATPGARAVVVGGGLLGLEAAHGLSALGYVTTVVHRRQNLMNRQLNSEGAAQLRSTLETTGLSFRMGDSLAELESESGLLSAALLESGERLACNLLLFATGISPNCSLAVSAGLAVDRGILVDERMRTSARGVYALGECSQIGDDCFGLAAPVREQAKVLAGELLGRDTVSFSASRYSAQLKISGIEIFSAGDIAASGDELILRDEQAGIYRRLIVDEQRLVSAILVGDKRGGAWYSQLIAENTNIAAFRPALMFGREACMALQPSPQAA